MDASIKQVQVTGGAAEDQQSGGRTRRRRRGAATTRRGGGATSPGTIVQLSASHVPGTGAEAAVGVNSSLTRQGAPISAVTNVTKLPTPAALVEPTPPAATSQEGGKKPVKVVLGPKKKGVKVVLAPPKVTKLHPVNKTRKVARKIRVSMAGFSKKLHRAKTIRNEASKHTIEEIKKVLHKAGLIKADSKAPESILRQMQADFMMLKNRAL